MSCTSLSCSILITKSDGQLNGVNPLWTRVSSKSNTKVFLLQVFWGNSFFHLLNLGDKDEYSLELCGLFESVVWHWYFFNVLLLEAFLLFNKLVLLNISKLLFKEL